MRGLQGGLSRTKLWQSLCVDMVETDAGETDKPDGFIFPMIDFRSLTCFFRSNLLLLFAN